MQCTEVHKIPVPKTLRRGKIITSNLNCPVFARSVRQAAVQKAEQTKKHQGTIMRQENKNHAASLMLACIEAFCLLTLLLCFLSSIYNWSARENKTAELYVGRAGPTHPGSNNLSSSQHQFASALYWCAQSVCTSHLLKLVSFASWVEPTQQHQCKRRNRVNSIPWSAPHILAPSKISPQILTQLSQFLIIRSW